MLLKKQLGKNIRKFRKELKLTQEQLAERVGIDTKNISKIENGINYPAAETLTAIAKSLNVDIYQLFIFDSEIPYNEMKKEIIDSLDNSTNILFLFKSLKGIS